MHTESHILITLTRAYCAPGRHYHDLRHIAAMLREGAPLGLSDAQVWAIWFHDAVYDPHRQDNEAQSAALARSELTRLGLPEVEVRIVEQIILDTATHIPSIPDSELVLDLDLGWLSLPWEQYSGLVSRIRKEYDFVSEADWRAGRAKVMEHLLQREPFYYTAAFKGREADARTNIRKELSLLRME